MSPHGPPKHLDGRTVVLCLSVLTLVALMSHRAALIFAIGVIDLCAIAGWYA